ncbi:aminotransferase class I/II-fold pyridoxal phosphate-dependent enzyme [Sporosarcina cascadiensis]|uniref:aminotransferase class I/II-fold pyridoxal phosphate-dependent enzyme n=1 Tax=Sporosarcina cascadiensis TaxID=2660747 RepID=UPI0018919280|nr:aminotransferase class I/II-fold pyridoxal phosphate-dependent enzyme [Sporosarcina cascadiensis]
MSYEDRPLIQALEGFRAKQPVSFHVPGHKNGELSGLPMELRNALSYDVTELTGLDDLHEPSEAILKAEEKLAKLYHSDQSFFLVNGSTVGNLAMLYATVGRGDTVLVQRNAHKSVFHALELTGAQAVFLSPLWDERTRSAGGVAAADVKAALINFPDVKAAVFTNPTYYGLANKEMREIIDVCHAYNVPVLVDEAHGAHFIVNKGFPEGALALGADVVVQSAHKTLPAMTMASFLHVRSDLVNTEKVAHYLHMLQSSSPSYLLMASLDDARHYAETYGETDYEELQLYRQRLLEGLRGIDNIDLIETDDLLKLIIRVKGQSGFTVQEALEEQGIYSELADLYQVLLVLPLVKASHNRGPSEAVNKFKLAAKKLSALESNAVQVSVLEAVSPISAVVYSIDELQRMKTIWVSFKKAAGKVAGQAVIPYPPGIPLLCAGERITEGHCRQLQELVNADAHFQGAIDLEKMRIQTVIE